MFKINIYYIQSGDCNGTNVFSLETFRHSVFKGVILSPPLLYFMAEVELCPLSIQYAIHDISTSDTDVCHHWGCVSFKMFG